MLREENAQRSHEVALKLLAMARLSQLPEQSRPFSNSVIQADLDAQDADIYLNLIPAQLHRAYAEHGEPCKAQCRNGKFAILLKVSSACH